jgi:hypothetical protein
VVSAATDVSDLNNGWHELRRVGADLLPVAMKSLAPADTWQIELLDAEETTVFRIRVVSELPS